MAHIGGPVPDEQFQRLPVRQVSLATADPVLQKMRVTALFEHLLVIIGLQESCMAVPEMVDQLFADFAQVCKNADPDGRGGDDKTVWVRSVVCFGKGGDRQCPGRYRLMTAERLHQLRVQRQPGVLLRGRGDINRQPVTF